MTKKPTTRRPLVADKRYGASKPKPKAKPKAAPRKRRPSTRKRRGGIIGAILGLFRWVFRLLWRLTWRSAAVVFVLVACAVGYVSMTLPPSTELIDGRARGSVTLLDRDAQVFAWRGDQFSRNKRPSCCVWASLTIRPRGKARHNMNKTVVAARCGARSKKQTSHWRWS